MNVWAGIVVGCVGIWILSLAVNTVERAIFAEIQRNAAELSGALSELREEVRLLRERL